MQRQVARGNPGMARHGLLMPSMNGVVVTGLALQNQLLICLKRKTCMLSWICCSRLLCRFGSKMGHITPLPCKLLILSTYLCFWFLIFLCFILLVLT
jgi:hypothetical protein